MTDSTASKTQHAGERTSLPSLPTRVGRAGWTEHWLRGAAVFGELLGHVEVWDIWSRSLGGPDLDQPKRALLDDVTMSGGATDPRLPPMKTLRLLASYGGELPALGALIIAQQDAWIGAWAPAKAAADLVDLRRAALPANAQPGDHPSDEAVESVLRDWLSHKRRPAGFGVPARPADERLVALEKRLEAIGWADKTYFRLLRQAAVAMKRLRKVPPNITAGGAAVALDIGFNPRQIGMIFIACSLPYFAGNALEGAIQAPELLQRLPPETVQYVGPEPRQSPRAAAKGSR